MIRKLLGFFLGAFISLVYISPSHACSFLDPKFGDYFSFSIHCATTPSSSDCQQPDCASIKVNETSDCFSDCKEGHCTLEAAVTRANLCAVTQSASITFDPAIFPATSIDFSAPALPAPFIIGGAHPVTIDGGNSRVLMRGNNTVNYAFQTNSPNVTFKTLIFQDLKKSALVIGAAATNTDVRNVSISSTSSSDDGIRIDTPATANANDNVPVFIRPGPIAGQFVAYVILPKDSDIHFYQKNPGSNEMEWVGLERNLLPDPNTGKLEYSDLLDVNKSLIDQGSMQIVAGLLPGFSAGDKLVALVKNKDKNISFVRTGLPSTFFTDSDNDNLSDDDEIRYFGTDPHNADSDGNKTNDYAQVIDPDTNVPRVKKNPDGTYAFVAGNFTSQAQVQTQNNNSNPSNPNNDSGKAGGCMMNPNPSSPSNMGLGIAWILSGFLFMIYRTKKHV